MYRLQGRLNRNKQIDDHFANVGKSARTEFISIILKQFTGFSIVQLLFVPLVGG
jgi:hypothetical protein